MPASPDAVIPIVVVAATREHAPGARLSVGGLAVIDRAVKQLAAASTVIVASDGAIRLPAALPTNARVESVPDTAAARALALRHEAPLVGADVVRLRRDDLDHGMRVTDERSRRAAEDAVFASLFRADLGFVARRLNKPLSVPFTRYVLCRWRITPNQITLLAAALGVAGCGLIATGRWGLVVLGFMLEQLQSILDGCDGELARVRFQQSKLGAWLDTFVDDVLNVMLTVAAGVGLYRASGQPGALVAGIAGGAMLVLANVIIMRDMRRQQASGDLMDMVWWFSGGRRLAELSAGAAGGGSSSTRPSLGGILFTLGRRDSAILIWLIFAVLNQLTLVLVMAFIIAAAWFFAALVQVITRPNPGERPA